VRVVKSASLKLILTIDEVLKLAEIGVNRRDGEMVLRDTPLIRPPSLMRLYGPSVC